MIAHVGNCDEKEHVEELSDQMNGIYYWTFERFCIIAQLIFSDIARVYHRSFLLISNIKLLFAIPNQKRPMKFGPNLASLFSVRGLNPCFSSSAKSPTFASNSLALF